MVLALVLLPTAATGGLRDDSVPLSRMVFQLLVTLVKVGIFVTVMLVVGRRVIPWLMHYTAHTGSRELFRLAVYAIAIGVAFGAAKMFDVSFALGAFFAGMVMGESNLSQQATEEALPLRDAFAVLFFVSVGMLLNPAVFVDAPLALAGDRGHHRRRQGGARLGDRARLQARQSDRARRRRGPRPDRRVLLHPDRPRASSSSWCRRWRATWSWAAPSSRSCSIPLVFALLVRRPHPEAAPLADAARK